MHYNVWNFSSYQSQPYNFQVAKDKLMRQHNNNNNHNNYNNDDDNNNNKNNKTIAQSCKKKLETGVDN